MSQAGTYPNSASEEGETAQALAAAVRDALGSGDLAGARQLAERLVELFPADRQGYVLKAQALVAEERLAEALETLRAALPGRENDRKLLSFMRNIALRHEGPAAAFEYALKFAELAPDDLKNQLFLIDWTLQGGDLPAALARAEGVVAKHPMAPQGFMLKAQVLAAQGHSIDALQTLRDTLPAHGEDVKFLSLIRNMAFQTGCIEEAAGYALRIKAIDQADAKNRTFLVQCYLALGAFQDALAHAEELSALTPSDCSALMLRAQALVALHRVNEAIGLLEAALTQHPDDERLLHLTRSVAFQNGRFDRAADHALRLAELQPDDDRNKAFAIHAFLAAGEPDRAKEYLRSFGDVPPSSFLRKEGVYLNQYDELKERAPTLMAAWEAALAQRPTGEERSSGKKGSDLGATMIQYWSQGTPPADVQIVCDNWRQLFEEQRLGQVEVFDRVSATAWIAENAPEFAGQFSKAFHYAMESDIFRIAFASKRPCIYMDIDSWPLEHTAEILRFAVQSGSSMLYFRTHRPVIVNGFFVSVPDCPFFKELVGQCLEIDIDALPKDYLALEGTFGPSRYNKVFLDLLAASANASVVRAADLPGCSTVLLGKHKVHFAHEAAIASVRPPFPLGYKVTGDYWKYFSLPQ